MTRPNGIAFSPEEKVLYVAQSDSKNPIIKAFPVRPDGTLGRAKVLYNFASLTRKYPGSPDGSVLYMTVDDCLCRLKTKTKGANWKNR
jgi:gluconolactonase